MRKRLGGFGARSAALSFVVALATFHGQARDETPSHREVGHLSMTLCDARPIAHETNGHTCGSHRWRVTTDGAGRFVIPRMQPGWYIVSGRSNDVAWFESLAYLRPSRSTQSLFVCSYKAQPHDCPSPRTFGRTMSL